MERFSRLACDDVRRVLFFYVLCDNCSYTEHLNLVEALLQDRIRSRSDEIENAISAPSITQDNLPDRWENDFSVLEHASGCEPLELLGDEAISSDPLIGNAV